MKRRLVFMRLSDFEDHFGGQVVKTATVKELLHGT